MVAASRKKRGPTTNENVRKVIPSERMITFKANGTPTGTSKSKFSNTVSDMVRDRVPCTYKSWDLVDDDLKTAVWMDVKDFWNIKDDDLKKAVVKYMGQSWKVWKVRLRRDFITKADPENPKNPWDYGHKIEPEQWEEFKAYVASDEFQKLSAKGKENACKNIHPHRLGSGGYETTLLKWKKTDVILMDSSETVVNSSTDTRSFTWLMARAVPTEDQGVFKIPNPATQDVLKRVDTVSQKTSQGAFHPVRHNDILTTSIGTPEHPGRVRGSSGWIGIKAVFGNGSRRNSQDGLATRADVSRLIAQALDIQAQEFHRQMAEAIQQAVVVPACNSPQLSRGPTQVSCNFDGPLMIDDEQVGGLSKEPILCNIFASLKDAEGGIVKTLVAHGRFDPSLGGIVHHEQLQQGQMRVSIDQVVEGYETLPLPFPNDEHEYLGETAGGFTKWPTYLVEQCNKNLTHESQFQIEKVVETRKVDETGKDVQAEKMKDKPSTAASAIRQPPLLDDETLKRLDKSARFLYNILTTLSGTIEFTLELFGLGAEATTYLIREDIVDVFKDGSVSITILQTFFMSCAERLGLYGNTRFFFLDPFMCSDNQMTKDLDRTTAYLISFFSRVEDKSSFILLPYMERALNVHLLGQRNPKFIWKIIESPKQMDSTSCGYYVMRAMHDITTKFVGVDVMPNKIHPNAPGPYHPTEIAEVNGVLIDFLRRKAC